MLFVMTNQVLVSGGVDSTVCAALLRTALREDQVIALHIDNGEFTLYLLFTKTEQFYSNIY